MLTLECPRFGMLVLETELSPGNGAKKSLRPLAAEFNMWHFKKGPFTDASVAAGVAH